MKLDPPTLVDLSNQVAVVTGGSRGLACIIHENQGKKHKKLIKYDLQGFEPNNSLLCLFVTG